MTLTPGVELPGVGASRVACQLQDSHVVDIHTVKESVRNNNNNTAGRFDVPVGFSSQSVPDPCGGAGW